MTSKNIPLKLYIKVKQKEDNNEWRDEITRKSTQQQPLKGCFPSNGEEVMSEL